MNTTLIVILAVINIPVYYLFFKLFFADAEDFGEAIRFWITPDSWSFLRGEYLEDMWAEIKLGLFLFLCIGAPAAEYFGIIKLIEMRG